MFTRPYLPFSALQTYFARLVLTAGFTVAVLAASPCQAEPVSRAVRAPHTITYDRYSLKLDGKRIFLYSGEIHPFRLPSPSVWRDVLDKIKAAGFTGISVYFDWGYHSPSPGKYDFTGIRNMDQFLDVANDVGLYVIARPGPYINAEVDGGGFPAWLAAQPGNLRSTDPLYLRWAYEWLGHIDAIIARHQLTNGTGSVIAYQVENEFYDPTAVGMQYMQDLKIKARADGITVPFTFNEANIGSTLFITGPGAVNLPGFDNYPQGFDPSNPEKWSQVPDFTVNRTLLKNSPLFSPEFGGGATDVWGGPGYQNCYELTNANYENVFYKSLIGQGLTMINFYMTYGGTSWGWLPYAGNASSFITAVYTSYDYGAAIREPRLLTDKYAEQKRIAYLLKAVAPITETDPVTTVTPPTNSAILQYTRENPKTKTAVYVLRHADATSTRDDSTHFSVETPDGHYASVPQQAGSALEIRGRDAKLLLANLNFKRAHLVYSTSELMTEADTGDVDQVVLYAPAGQHGETVLRFATAPTVEVLAGKVASTYDAATGDLRLNYVHEGLIRVQVAGPSGTLSLLIGDYAATARLWQPDLEDRQVLASGPYLVRSAKLVGDVIEVTGDLDAPTTLEVFAPQSVDRVVWNGYLVNAQRTRYGTLAAQLQGPVPVQLPSLNAWKFQFESYERNANFDDSAWTVANHLTTNNFNVPGTLPVLYEDDYGFHHGDVWYRGHFAATGNETGITLDGEGGVYGIYSVWLNGIFLGTQPSGEHTFDFPPAALRKGQGNVVAVLVMNMGHNESFSPFDNGRNTTRDPRGLRTALLQGDASALTWRIQGNLGGERVVDPARGWFNNGGLYGERNGWHLPLFDDGAWVRGDLPDRWASRRLPAGVGWYRTTFNLNLPENSDVPIGIDIDDPTALLYRALIFVNGWQMGIYANELGPQRTFPVQPGILNPHGLNTIAIAVWGEEGSANGIGSSGGLGKVQLVRFGNFSGGVPIDVVPAPQVSW
ncbi:MAG TPA: beta-galactosidase [Chthoniobacterales bacterium]